MYLILILGVCLVKAFSEWCCCVTDYPPTQVIYQGQTQQQPTSSQSQVMLRSNIAPSPQPPPPTKSEQRKRPNAVKIVHPDTNEEVNVDDVRTENNNVTPSQSNDSSARETPQPVRWTIHLTIHYFNVENFNKQKALLCALPSQVCLHKPV